MQYFHEYETTISPICFSSESCINVDTNICVFEAADGSREG